MSLERQRRIAEFLTGLPSVKQVDSLRPKLAAAAQEGYDAWEQDADGVDVELGAGGICQDIADALAGVLNEAGIDTITLDSNGVGDQHVWAMARFREGVYEIDIPFWMYESGGGYVWRKIPNVLFQPHHISVFQWSVNPDDFETYRED